MALFGAVAFALLISGCSRPRAHEASLQAVRDTLVVVPVYTNAPTSGFPVSARNVVCSAHALSHSDRIASVRGYPMYAPVKPAASQPTDIALGRDWLVLYSTRDLFTPNLVDPDVQLHTGDTVFFAGFRWAKLPDHGPAAHAAAPPEVVAARVIEADGSTGESQDVVTAEAPLADYRGFSGGPAAVVGSDGRARVWGVTVGGEASWWPPWRPHAVIYFARLKREDVSRFTMAKLLNPDEVPAATSRPTVR